MTRRLRFVVLAVLAGAALALVAAVSAANVRPLLASSPFAPLSGPSVPCLNGGLPCYLPSEIQQAYNFPSGPSAPNGAGQTIVVVTAYGAPFVGPDIQTFGALTGVPYPPNLTVVPQQTAIPTAQGSGQTYRWEVETDLDVEWAYAMAPRAHIVLAVAKSDDTLDIAQVMREVLPTYPGAIVTQSFGMDETGPASDPALVSTFSPMYLDVLRHGGTVLAGSGDNGASNGTEIEQMLFPELGVTPSAMASYPASDPLVLAVGGTEGNPYPDGLLSDAGTYGGEQAWNEISPFGGAAAGGGAPSAVFDAPPWQRSLHTKDRLVPDVSYNAALVGGALVVLSCRPNQADGGVTLDPSCVDPSRQGYISVGGTSAGAPQWAAIVALGNQVRMSQAKSPLGLVSPLLYELAKDKRAYARDFNDIMTGSNALDLRAFGAPAPSEFGFDAAPGYDLATGLGTPNVANLLGDLAKRDSGEIPGNVARGPKGDKPNKVKHHRFDPSK